MVPDSSGKRPIIVSTDFGKSLDIAFALCRRSDGTIYAVDTTTESMTNEVLQWPFFSDVATPLPPTVTLTAPESKSHQRNNDVTGFYKRRSGKKQRY
jgi:hypothetical protein